MRILQIISSVDSRGGGPIEGLIQHGSELATIGFDVETASLDAPAATMDTRLDLRTVHLLGPSHLGYGYAPRARAWLDAHVRHYDAVIIHGLWQYHGLVAAAACRAQGVPYVVFPHGMLDPWFNRRYPLKRLKKWLYWPWAEYRVLRDAHAVLFTTEEELHLARQSFGLYQVRERMVGYGIAHRRLPPGTAAPAFFSRFPHLQGKRLVLYLSRIHPKKGCDLLVDAFARVAARDERLHLVLAGPDDVGLLPKLQQQVEAAGLHDRVTFPGMLTGPLKWGAYDAAEVFILPSHQENFGIVVAEALASRLPVLTTHQVNIWRPIERDGAGIVRPDTAAGTLNLLNTWLDLPADARERMRDAAARCFDEHFEVGKVIGNLAQALRDAKLEPAGAPSFTGRWNPSVSEPSSPQP